MKLRPGEEEPVRQVSRYAAVAALLAGVATALAGCGSHGHSAAARGGDSGDATDAVARTSPGDWTRFDYDAQRSGVGPRTTGIDAANVGRLQTRVVNLDGAADSSPILLHAVRVGGVRRNVIIVTTSYGHTIAVGAKTGRVLWEYRSSGTAAIEGTSQVTTATPVADPGRQFVFAASPDGLIHKLAVSSGAEVRSGDWPVRVTLDPKEEKIGGALNISGNYLLAVVGGYEENIPTAQHYQGHVAVIDRRTGQLVRVFNSLCSDRHTLMQPRMCNANDAAVWARSGVVVEPGSGRLLIATGNGHFNGSTWWGDSVLELSPDGSTLLHNWTPGDQAQLDRNDTDIGSTAPALLPPIGGRHLALQGGKDGALRLLDLDRLNGTTGGPGPRTGGELQTISTVGGGMVFTAPAVWKHAGRVYVFVGDVGGTACYAVETAGGPHLIKLWSVADTTTSPIVAGGLLYAFDLLNRTLDIRVPTTGQLLRSLPAAVGHWSSPIAIGGRVILPVGDYQKHPTRGQLFIYHLPGR